jgi:hypothetical protein
VDSPGPGKPPEKRKVGSSTLPLTTTLTSANVAVDHFGCPALLMDLLTRAFDGLREDVADACGVLAEDMGADA